MNWVNRMFLFVKKYGKWRGKLISEYVLLTIFVVCIVAISFFATVHIVNSSAMEQSRQSLDVIFQQAEERIKILEDDIESLHLNVIHNDSIVEFFRAKNVAERWDNLSGFYQVVGNNRRLNRNLQNVVLYDTAGNLIASKGDVYLPRAEEIARKGMYLYSNRMLDSRTGEVYFEVGMPVFQENRGNPNRSSARSAFSRRWAPGTIIHRRCITPSPRKSRRCPITCFPSPSPALRRPSLVKP